MDLRKNTAIALLAVCWSAYQSCAQTCQDQFKAMAPASMQSYSSFIDTDTPDSACAKQLGSDSLQLVFSDEFNYDGGYFAVKENDPKWTAEEMYYAPTRDEEVYLPSQVTTRDGAAVITVEKGVGTAPSQQPSGDVVTVPKNFKSGFMSGWNKFCFTGGYVETRVQLPGVPGKPSYWPAIWMMGNLGRAGYMQSTGGMWPYSFNQCPSGANVGPNPAVYPWGPPVTPQMFQACGAVGLPEGILPEDWDMAANQGRGAPEIDIFEAVIPRNGQPAVSQTLQMAPVEPPGTSFAGRPGLSYPGSNTAFRTHLNPYRGNQYQDSISALSEIDSSFFSSFHTFGVDWFPGEYIRWYIDGTLVYEIDKTALGPQSNGTWSVPARQIPVEAMYLIMNVGISKDFSPDLDLTDLEPLPGEMLVDYIRIYQRSGSINLGCSPSAYPTSTFIACNRNRYSIDSSQDRLITGTCPSGKNAAATVAPLPMTRLCLTLLAILLLLL